MIREIISYKDFKWSVHRKVRDTKEIEINKLKELWNMDIALRKNGYIYFCNIIEDIDFEECEQKE